MACGKSLKVTNIKILQYLYNILAGVLDEGANIMLGGSRNETISGRLGRSYLEGAKWYAKLGYHGVNKMFFWQDNHCLMAYDPDDNVEDEVWSWIKDKEKSWLFSLI